MEAQVSTTIHQTLIGTSADPAPTVLITTGQGSTVKTEKSQHADTPKLQLSDSDKIKPCPYCKALHQNSDWSSTETATQISAITKENFDATHRQFLNRGQKYVLPAGGCIQFLLATMKDRKAAVESHSDICPICLAIPNVKHSNGQCKGKHED